MVIISQEDFKPNFFGYKWEKQINKKGKKKNQSSCHFLWHAIIEHIVLLYGDYQDRKEA
jgi:hypothetical protein